MKLCWGDFLCEESYLVKEGLNAFIFVLGISLQFVSTNSRDELGLLIQQHAQSGLTLCSIGGSIYPLQLFLSPFWKKDWKIRKYIYVQMIYSILYIIDLMQKINNPFKENLQKINLFKRVTYFLVHDITNRSPPLFWGSSSSQTLSWSSPPSLSSSWVPLVFPIQGVEFCLLLISPHIVLLTTSDDIFELWWP